MSHKHSQQKNHQQDKENRRLEKVVRDLLHRIDDNQQIQSHFNAFELSLLHCETLTSLLDQLLVESVQHFHLDAVSLLLNDSDHQMRTLCERMKVRSYDGHLQFFHNDVFFNNVFHSPVQVRLGHLDTLERSKIFPQSLAINSAALLPLIRHNKIIGCINFGSVDDERFTVDKSADFLEHLARIMAVCLENSFSHESLRYQCGIDMLTQIYNRRSFDLELDKELARASRHEQALFCLFLDIDYFKKVNDKYGHQSGDDCLYQVAKVITQHLRKSDIFARYGGEEFVALLPNESEDGAVQVAERVRQAIETLEIDNTQGDNFKVTISIGVASVNCRKNMTESDLNEVGVSLLSKADQAMYEAKNRGRNQVCSV